MKLARNVALSLICASILSCNQSGVQGAAEEPPAPAVPFASFRQTEMVIDRLDAPVEPPYAAGSTKSASGLTSTNPAVVGVDGQGNLIGHKNGEAQVRAQSGSVLKVLVQAGKTLTIVPARLELQAGDSQTVQVLVDGQPAAAGTVHWQTENPNVAAAFGSAVQAGLTPGTVSLTAVLGDTKAQVKVVVRPSTAAMTVEPAQVTMSIGAVQQLKVPPFYARDAKWTTSNPALLSHLHDGLFLAKAPGAAQACVVHMGAKACARVTITR